MIREHRNREKLINYYKIFINKGITDPNVHPWIKESWELSKQYQVNPKKIPATARLSAYELAQLQSKHSDAIEYLDNFIDSIVDFLHEYNLCLTIMDSECTVLKKYANPTSRLIDRLEGVSLTTKNVGTLSCNIVKEHKVPFWVFGPEIWLEELHEMNSGSVPIMVNGELTYIVSLTVMEYEKIPQDVVLALLFTLKTALELNIRQSLNIKAQKAILDAAPFAVYHIMSEDKIIYANRMGEERLSAINAINENKETAHLKDIVLNYTHTPIYDGFQGISCYNRETTWITNNKTYEDITTVVPLKNSEDDEDVQSVVTVSMPIEDLRTLVAHASGYTAKYSLSSMVGESKAFVQMKERAYRVARNKNHILLQGEAGIGKQRLAHGIHMASMRMAGPLISINCADSTPELLEQDIFGAATDSDVSHPGKLELASKGTLFIDEIEKLPSSIAKMLAKALSEKKTHRIGESLERSIDVRIIAASDANLRRLTEKGQFDEKLFNIISRSIIRVPSLRSRRDDIPMLSINIIEELSKQHQMEPKVLLPESLEVLRTYDWPGNIKQLQSVLEYSFFNTSGHEIYPTDINLMGSVKPDNKWKTDKEIFLKAWKAAGGNVSRLSNLLSVSRVTLYRYIKKYGLEK